MAAPRKPAAKPGGTLTTKAITEAAAELAARRKRIREAAFWCIENGTGGAKAESSELFGDVTRNEVNPMIKKIRAGKDIDLRDHHLQIMTNKERLQVAEWILACADNQDPKDRTEVSVKIRQILRARHADNKRRKYGKGSVPLNESELDAVKSRMPTLSHKFFSHYYPWCRAHGVEIHEGVDCAQDEKRAKKMNESTVQRHFYGNFGLEAELVDTGIMDPETKVGAAMRNRQPVAPLTTPISCRR